MTKAKLQWANPSIPATGLELKVPPLALMVVMAAVLWLASLAGPAFDFTLLPNAVLAMGFAAAGAFACLAGVVSFRRARTTVDPRKPDATAALVVSGIYRYSRNPMYLGFLLMLLGWALFLSNGLALLLLPAFVLYMNRFQIRPEERVLAARFAGDYVAYVARVHRWL